MLSASCANSTSQSIAWTEGRRAPGCCIRASVASLSRRDALRRCVFAALRHRSDVTAAALEGWPPAQWWLHSCARLCHPVSRPESHPGISVCKKRQASWTWSSPQSQATVAPTSATTAALHFFYPFNARIGVQQLHELRGTDRQAQKPRQHCQQCRHHGPPWHSLPSHSVAHSQHRLQRPRIARTTARKPGVQARRWDAESVDNKRRRRHCALAERQKRATQARLVARPKHTVLEEPRGVCVHCAHSKDAAQRLENVARLTMR